MASAATNSLAESLFGYLRSDLVQATGSAASGTVVSSFSISLALLLVLNGAKEGSPIFRELSALLGLPGAEGLARKQQLNEAYQQLVQQLGNDQSEGLTLSVANSVWVRTPFQFSATYLETVQKYLNASAHPLTSAAEVNTWCSKETRGKIQQVVEEDAVQHAVSVLVNALYFKGLWESQFEARHTQPAPFVMAGGHIVQCHMMHRKFERREGVQWVEAPNAFSGVRIPYKGGKFAAVALLPEEGQVPAAALQALHGQDALAWHGEKVHLALPRFKIEYSVMLKEAMLKMGVGSLFAPSNDLDDMMDFSNMTPQPLCVDEVVHKVFLEVNEEGTEAAAVTAVVMTRAFVPPRIITFDRPFVFAVQHLPSNLILFSGVVDVPDVLPEGEGKRQRLEPPPGYPNPADELGTVHPGETLPRVA